MVKENYKFDISENVKLPLKRSEAKNTKIDENLSVIISELNELESKKLEIREMINENTYDNSLLNESIELIEGRIDYLRDEYNSLQSKKK